VVLAAVPGVNALVQAASRGIGFEILRQLLSRDRDRRFVATCRDPRKATALQALAAENDGRVLIVPLELADEGSIRAAADRTAEYLDELQLLINVGGFLHRPGQEPERRLDDVNTDSLHASFAVNAVGPLLVVKHFRRFLPRRGRAVVASLSARVGSIGDNRLGGWYAYRASKAAQNMFTRCLSVELARRHRGVICVALHPGTVDTDLSRPFQARVPSEKLFSTERAARQLLDVIVSLKPEDNGAFFAWDGQPVPW
jgi:NAD(P)-dependent dehydrogenase (short-subunit alcohol dehydrogenase family)